MKIYVVLTYDDYYPAGDNMIAIYHSPPSFEKLERLWTEGKEYYSFRCDNVDVIEIDLKTLKRRTVMECRAGNFGKELVVDEKRPHPLEPLKGEIL